MNEIQVFSNAELGEVRTTVIDGEVMFVGKDVAEILGYADPNKAIAMHVDADDKLNDKLSSSWGWRLAYQRVRSLQSYSFKQDAKCKEV